MLGLPLHWTRAVLAAAGLLAGSSLCGAVAQTIAASGSCPYWIDAATGHRVRTGPPGWSPTGLDNPYNPDPNHVSYGGHNFVKQPDGTWIDAATGNPVQTGPPGWSPTGLDNPYNPDPNHVSYGRHNFVRIPCPPPVQTGWTGGYGGGYIVDAFGNIITTERFDATGAVTNQFHDGSNGVGGGINAGWQWELPGGGVFGPAFDAYFPQDEVSHPFAGGNFLRSTVDFTATFQARAGVEAAPDLLLYGQTGLAVGSQTLKVRLGGMTSSTSDMTTGYALGGGAEWRLPGVSLGPLARSPSLFVEYSHIWWSDAHFPTPASSAAFNYTWARDSNVVKGGFRVRF